MVNRIRFCRAGCIKGKMSVSSIDKIYCHISDAKGSIFIKTFFKNSY